ncbi:MAG: hypothetical protein AABW50_01340 [Nanoarchaeota archaeon]
MGQIGLNVWYVNYNSRNIAIGKDLGSRGAYIVAISEESVKNQIVSWSGTGDYRCKINSLLKVGKLTVKETNGRSLDSLTTDFKKALGGKGTIQFQFEEIKGDINQIDP